MRVMARTRQEIVKDEINAGAVQVLPAEGLFKVVSIQQHDMIGIFSLFLQFLLCLNDSILLMDLKTIFPGEKGEERVGIP